MIRPTVSQCDAHQAAQRRLVHGGRQPAHQVLEVGREPGGGPGERDARKRRENAAVTRMVSVPCSIGSVTHEHTDTMRVAPLPASTRTLVDHRHSALPAQRN
jgi:hypothetical protein